MESGLAIVERDNQYDKWDNLGYRRADSVFGEILQGAKERPYHKKITALTESRLLRIERSFLSQVMDMDYDIARRLKNSLEQDTYATEDRLALIAGTTLGERLPIVLLDITDGRTDVRIQASQGSLAKAVGGERATVNQILMRLKRRRIVLDERGLVINGEDGLKVLKSMAEGISPVVSSNSRTPSNGTTHSMIPS